MANLKFKKKKKGRRDRLKKEEEGKEGGENLVKLQSAYTCGRMEQVSFLFGT